MVSWRSALERLVLALTGVVLVEVGYLWGVYHEPRDVPPTVEVAPVEVASEEVVLVAETQPVESVAAPVAETVAATTTRAPTRKRPQRGRDRGSTAVDVADCARSGDPLCGLPR